METNAEDIVDQATKLTEVQNSCRAELSEAQVTLTKNIMFPSLSDEMLAKIVKVRCHGDASTQSR